MLKSKKFNIKQFGELLSYSLFKKRTSDFITNDKINNLCNICLKNGAL